MKLNSFLIKYINIAAIQWNKNIAMGIGNAVLTSGLYYVSSIQHWKWHTYNDEASHF